MTMHERLADPLQREIPDFMAGVLAYTVASATENDTAEAQLDRAIDEARFEVIASIRDNVRTLSPERQTELFADFADAVERKDIDYIADTILNWATGGYGYKRAGLPVNRLARRMAGKYKNDPEWARVMEIIAEEREKLSE